MSKITKLGVIGACAMFLATPVYAAKQTMDDQSLAGITGKASNQATVSGNSSLNEFMNSAAGTVQVGYYQWNDDHSADASDHKGANDQSGANSMVQQNINAVENTLAWGGASQAATVNTASIGGNQKQTSWWIMYLGGF
ncbi:MAG TPA: hypothetical protein VKA13_07480 [Gammaproteobacteria bacterium]|nr:hypothetical protein [Gammaproteobacteria bacterium]